MEVGKLTVTIRETTGKSAVTKLRATGKVPGVCYGASPNGRIDPLPIIVDVKALRAALDPVRKQNTVIDLTIESPGSAGARSDAERRGVTIDGGKAAHRFHALVKDYQVDELRRDITHVDLLVIDPNKEVHANVPIEFIGKPKGAIDGGQIRTILRALEVRAKPSDIPVKLTVDVSPLEIGDVIHVHAVALPANVITITNRDLAVVTCSAPEEEKIEVAAVPVEGAAAAPGAAAATPAAGDAKAGAPAAGAKAGDAKAAPAAAGKAAPAAGAKPAKK